MNNVVFKSRHWTITRMIFVRILNFTRHCGDQTTQFSIYSSKGLGAQVWLLPWLWCRGGMCGNGKCQKRGRESF